MNFMTAEVGIKVDDSKLPAQLAKVKSAVTKTVNKIKAAWGKMATSFKAAWGKIVRYAKWGGLAIAGAFFLVTRAAMKQEDAINRLNITLKATGHAAGFTKKQLIEQAAALQQVTRFGDETIIAMQTMLLTFKNIKGDEFKRATEAALDMASAEANVSGRAVDLTSTSIRLGKALNDPILGMSALSRVGVQFTEVQKEMIKRLVETGDVAGAQAVILRELEGEFGGTARDVNTASGALKQMWNALGDVAEKIGAAFIPGIKDSARAVKEWAERNQERIGQFAERAVAYMTYVKDVLWAFIKFVQSDWPAGLKAGLGISLEFFKGFGESLIVVMVDVASRAWRAFVRVFAEGLGKWLVEAGKPTGVLGKLSMLSPAVAAGRIAMMGAGAGLVSKARAVEAPEGPSLGEKLKGVWEDVGVSIKDIVPPELAEAFEEPLLKLNESLGEIGTTAEEIEEPMEKALVTIPEKASEAFEKATSKLREWGSAANDIWNNLADIAVSALDSTADALTDLALTGKADFASLAESILRDLTRMIIKQMMFNALSTAFGGTFGMPMPGGGGGEPSLQHGGEVTKTGLAVVHKGEKWPGVNNEQEGKVVALNINVNAIDAVGTYQFLSRNKRVIATMMQGALIGNHPLRSSIKKR